MVSFGIVSIVSRIRDLAISTTLSGLIMMEIPLLDSEVGGDEAVLKVDRKSPSLTDTVAERQENREIKDYTYALAVVHIAAPNIDFHIPCVRFLRS